MQRMLLKRQLLHTFFAGLLISKVSIALSTEQLNQLLESLLTDFIKRLSNELPQTFEAWKLTQWPETNQPCQKKLDVAIYGYLLLTAIFNINNELILQQNHTWDITALIKFTKKHPVQVNEININLLTQAISLGCSRDHFIDLFTSVFQHECKLAPVTSSQFKQMLRADSLA